MFLRGQCRQYSVRQERRRKVNISDFAGMSWKKANTCLSKNTHLLALSTDSADLEVARTAAREGMDAGMATLVAHLFAREHGYAAAARMGITIYKELIEEIKSSRPEKAKELRKKISDTEEWLYFSSEYNRAFRGSSREAKWALKPCFKEVSERAGLANIMMAVAARGLDYGTTGSKLAAQALFTLLSGGKTKGKGKKRK